MRKKSLLVEIAACLALAVFLFAGCPTDSDPDSGSGSVTGVAVSPDSASVAPGGTQQFTATVTVSGDAAKTVAWKVEGPAKQAGTTISTAGLLTVATDETAETLTVTATSTADAAKSGAATVTVTSGGGPAADPGTLSISIGFEGAPVITGAPNGAISLSKSGAGGKAKTLSLSAAGYESPVWYPDGAAAGTSGASYTVDAAGLEARNHSVSFTGTRNGVLYAKEIPFTVVE